MNDNEKMRRKLWIEIAKVVTGSIACTDKFVPAIWANVALEEYDRVFKEKP